MLIRNVPSGNGVVEQLSHDPGDDEARVGANEAANSNQKYDISVDMRTSLPR